MSDQFKLLSERRFLPLFVTQFLGAFNDNVFKNALIVLLLFGTASNAEQGSLLVNLAAGLFILPFFLFSALAGQLADKYDKATLTRGVKAAELMIMALACFALYSGQVWLMLFILFLMGTQSAFFGPIKYSILPQMLTEDELVAGNAQIEMGTFVAILLGTICGSMLAGHSQAMLWLSIVLIAVAAAGLLASFYMPSAPSISRDLKVKLNPFTETTKLLKTAAENHPVFLSLLAISWFWLLGAAYLTQLPALTKDSLGGNNNVVTLLLCAFTIGVGVGSLLCERLSKGMIEIGIVPLGSIGLSLFGIDLYFAINNFQPLAVAGEFIGAGGFLSSHHAIRILVDIAMLGIFGGFYTVPLYAFIQANSAPKQRARIIAANNILNSLFMVVSSLLAILVLSKLHYSIAEFFLFLSVVNIAVSLYIYSTVPAFTVRFLIWMLTHTMYRVTHRGLDNIPKQGAAIIAANHVSYVDALLMGGAIRRPIRFIMLKSIYDIPVLHYIFKVGRTVPIVSSHVDSEVYDRAMRDIKEGLEAGDLFCIFPEGKLTTTGEMNEFKAGIERIIAETPVPVVPVALAGLWGSFFSHRGGPALSKLPRRFYSKVEIVAETPMAAEGFSVQELQYSIAEMLQQSESRNKSKHDSEEAN
ncbi:1-acyl-sn-glycerol-3-phosphate acyltransferase [Sinobacterium caligoides]|uniref:1-acyl-sn-glycerol-3-phosphate acyltransferase n=1 Tax=Sinobacterium caligoides TaxID=933926 RepID=A0A3N2DG48_9GAMM|nr:MFS transporter [Sinobacterium caligoides]ROR98701.1 1-acyl-sn-glycerol-3-phosphate acyltransferase [Sinobacterium caligoides]